MKIAIVTGASSGIGASMSASLQKSIHGWMKSGSLPEMKRHSGH